jgi:L-lactate dehydrogenase complex protein LldG
MNLARKEILDKLKNLVHPVSERPDFDALVYHSIEKPLDLAFKENLEKVNGSVYLCSSEKELFEKLKIFLSDFDNNRIICFEDEIRNSLKNKNFNLPQFSDIPDNIEVGITGCEFLVAHTGSILVSSAQKGGRRMFVYPPIHVVLAKRSQLTEYLENAYSNLTRKYGKELPSHIALISGPSRTADIEKTLVLGAHGPRELHVFLI